MNNKGSNIDPLTWFDNHQETTHLILENNNNNNQPKLDIDVSFRKCYKIPFDDINAGSFICLKCFLGYIETCSIVSLAFQVTL
jgi:hypothetical protein